MFHLAGEGKSWLREKPRSFSWNSQRCGMCRREERKNCLSLILKLDLSWEEGIPPVHISTGDRASGKQFGNVTARKGRRG